MGYRDSAVSLTSNMNYLIGKNIVPGGTHLICISGPILSLGARRQLLPATRRGQLNAFLSFKDFNMIFISGFTKVFIKWV